MAATTRRNFALGLAGSAALLDTMVPRTAALGMGSVEGTDALDIESETGKFKAFVRMSGSTTDTELYFWHRIGRYGVVDQNIKSLHWSLGVTYQRVRDYGNDGVTYISNEISYHLDSETGEFLDKFVNPYTGATVTPRYLRVGPRATKLTPSGASPVDEDSAMELPYDIEQSIGPVLITSNSVLLSLELKAGGDKIVAQDVITYRASLADMQNSELHSVPVSYTILDIFNWPAWMEMGDIRGVYVGRGEGEKVKGPEEFPRQLLDLIETHDPTFLSDPENWKGDQIL